MAKGTNGLYALEDNNLYALNVAHNKNTSDNMWHTRLGHTSLKTSKVWIVIVASILVVGVKCLLFVHVISW